MSIITLTTDFGLKDHFVGALKGKILSEFPDAQIIDISHDIDPFNTAEASYIVNAAYKSFPAGTVHLIGVDAERTPDVRHIAMKWNNQFFVCADNGIPGMLTQKLVPEKMVTINIHDRLIEGAAELDVFVKVACHLAKGGLLNVIGKDIDSLSQPTEIQPVIATDGNSVKVNVIYVDHLGNIVTNITKAAFLELSKGRSFEILLNPGVRQPKNAIKRIYERYSDIAASGQFPLKYYEGNKLAVFNEAGFLEIALYRANPNSVGTAKSLLGLNYRDTITITFS